MFHIVLLFCLSQCAYLVTPFVFFNRVIYNEAFTSGFYINLQKDSISLNINAFDYYFKLGINLLLFNSHAVHCSWLICFNRKNLSLFSLDKAM